MIFIFDETTNTIHFKDSFSFETIKKGASFFLKKWCEKENVMMIQQNGTKTIRKLTVEDVKELYENYPMGKIGNATDEEYHEMKMEFIYLQILHHFMVNSENECWDGLLQQMT